MAAEQPAGPLTLTGEPATGTCWTNADAPSDLAWFEVQWKATQDLESFSFDLIDPKGVKTVGSGYTVPPVNYGGRIDYSGSASWRGWRNTVDSSLTSVEQADTVDSWVPSKDQTGLLVLHLRFDPKVISSTPGATFAGIRATYTTLDGETGTVDLDAAQVFGSKNGC